MLFRSVRVEGAFKEKGKLIKNFRIPKENVFSVDDALNHINIASLKRRELLDKIKNNETDKALKSLEENLNTIEKIETKKKAAEAESY